MFPDPQYHKRRVSPRRLWEEIKGSVEGEGEGGERGDEYKTRMHALNNPCSQTHYRKFVMPRQPASQRIHSGEECGPCVLCEKSSIHYTHPVEWDDSLTQMIQQATNIQTSSCVCKACGDDFKRNHHKPHYIPRWITPCKVCAVPTCKSAEAPIVCKIADTYYIHSTLNIPTTSDDDTMLCPYHYHVVYRSLPGKVETYSRTRCTTCKKDLSGRTDHHHCPSPQIIRHHLQEKTRHNHEITPDSVICIMCYKAQMSILQGECLSTDLELMQVIVLKHNHRRLVNQQLKKL